MHTNYQNTTHEEKTSNQQSLYMYAHHYMHFYIALYTSAWACQINRTTLVKRQRPSPPVRCQPQTLPFKKNIHVNIKIVSTDNDSSTIVRVFVLLCRCVMFFNIYSTITNHTEKQQNRQVYLPYSFAHTHQKIYIAAESGVDNSQAAMDTVASQQLSC